MLVGWMLGRVPKVWSEMTGDVSEIYVLKSWGVLGGRILHQIVIMFLSKRHNTSYNII